MESQKRENSSTLFGIIMHVFCSLIKWLFFQGTIHAENKSMELFNKILAVRFDVEMKYHISFKVFSGTLDWFLKFFWEFYVLHASKIKFFKGTFATMIYIKHCRTLKQERFLAKTSFFKMLSFELFKIQ